LKNAINFAASLSQKDFRSFLESFRVRTANSEPSSARRAR
jgi:hypothetical protein